MSPEEISQFISEHPVILFGKGEKGLPRCGFTAQVQEVLEDVAPEYVMVNILADQDLRQYMKEFSDWPTFPQVYVKGEFVGGCDIVLELYEDGELQKLV